MKASHRWEKRFVGRWDNTVNMGDFLRPWNEVWWERLTLRTLCGVGGEAVGLAVLTGHTSSLIGAAALHRPAAVQVHWCLRAAQVRHLWLAVLTGPLLCWRPREAELLIVLHRYGGRDVLWAIQSSSVIQAVGLVGRRARRWREQLAQRPKYLRTINIWWDLRCRWSSYLVLNIQIELMMLTFSMFGLWRWRLAVQSKARVRRPRAKAVGHWPAAWSKYCKQESTPPLFSTSVTSKSLCKTRGTQRDTERVLVMDETMCVKLFCHFLFTKVNTKRENVSQRSIKQKEE